MQNRATLPSPTDDIPNQSDRRARPVTVEDINVVFQPIVDLGAGWTVAYEALVRCKWPGFENPMRLFDWAQNENCIGHLGRVIREVAFGRCDDAPLFVNIHPRELNEGWLVRPDDPMFFHEHPVYVEVTESAAFDYFDLCLNVLREVSSRGGVYLVVDDLGAGYSNLKRVLDLEPRIVKLDLALVRGIEKNPRQRTLVRQVVALCQELGADVVAEGIETVDELLAVRDTGAHYGQGYLFARPAYPIPRATWPLPRNESRRGRLAGEPNSHAKHRV
ncbi:MAG TPA: EAL domain-containing protein [Polyangiaceae bacterium]|nr:EAL domain-containing protein [Polyangiaceae bacterium]